jgi:hypothetical protein
LSEILSALSGEISKQNSSEYSAQFLVSFQREIKQLNREINREYSNQIIDLLDSKLDLLDLDFAEMKNRPTGLPQARGAKKWRVGC